FEKLKMLSGITSSPYYLCTSVMEKHEYGPVLKYFFVELSPIITILYPATSMLPYDMLTSFDDELAITIISPVILHIKKPECHYQGVTESMGSVIYGSFKMLSAHYYGTTEEEKEVYESPMFKKMKYDIELNEEFFDYLGISCMMPDAVMETYHQYADPVLETYHQYADPVVEKCHRYTDPLMETYHRYREPERKLREVKPEIISTYEAHPTHDSNHHSKRHPKRPIPKRRPKRSLTYRIDDSIIQKSFKISKDKPINPILTREINQEPASLIQEPAPLIQEPAPSNQKSIPLSQNNFKPRRLLYAFIVFPLYIVCVIPLNFILYSSLAISTIYLLGQQWMDECSMIPDEIERRREEHYYKLRILALIAFFGTLLCIVPVVLFFMGFKAVYIAITDSIESCIYFSFQVAVGYCAKDHNETHETHETGGK
ncbi:15918_t:CDS:1, partial [Cetraspora pellucida]